MTEDGQGREEPAESESAEVESTQSLEGSSQQSKRPKAKRIDEAILKIADKMCANEHLKEQLDAAMKAGNNERTMFCQWMGMEASKLSEELWMSFMSESFNLIMRYRQQQLMQQQPQVPQVRPTSSAQTSTPVHHQSQGWQPPQLWSGNQPPFFDTSLRSLNASGLTGLDEQNAQPNTPEPVRSTLRTGELVARALQGLGD
ncbi:hypothetical protein FJT64_016491 [Amphibalanus amphitrite]|uniref:Uncharacterized protein n=1 Tax=Amphibalanus amphitrite TaxID=1232801 RepID=A0A6A4X5T9_AMPAM|nr:hypothetical protein FJT64_016491 [Amphibalanus amphitrite]